MEKEFAIVET